MTILVDSDVVISSLLSTTGASYLLLQKKIINSFYISSFSRQELEQVCERLDIKKDKLDSLIQKNLQIVKIDKQIKDIKNKYGKYVYDINDAHILAGAVFSKAGFIVSYNIKDYKIEKIRNDLNIIVFKPSMLIQYLRSLR
ncbi:MAG: hypothetical protein COU25_00780 [Candidatus Levybacteria bacterium CG10_big_fil_rev_8_21_14_0_10_35_13]|nr:MAG: hypothetical protein COU25_00780 [Candidatus Levybacteria bacterium CG10_big_fil_rev_8_21_14_0_10_35_13]